MILRLLLLAVLAAALAAGGASAAGAEDPDAPVCDPARASKRRSARVLSTARVHPYVVDGRFLGIHVSEIEEISPLRTAGVRDGDLVIEASGARLSDVEKATTFFCLIGLGDSFPFVVRRSSGEIETLVFPAAE